MDTNKYIYTIKANCQHCYKCLRNCFVKTIKFENAKSGILENGCVLCGNCTTICPQEAKTFIRRTDKISHYLDKPFLVSLAPSFFSHFDDPYRFVGFLKAHGAVAIQETALGADIVSAQYVQYMENTNKTLISTACPVVVDLVQMYYPNIIDYLAPFLSPMNAHAKILKNSFGDLPLIYIGPCYAKKKEGENHYDLILTYEEFDEFFTNQNLNLASYPQTITTPPYPQKGKLYPISGGVNFSLNGNWIQHLAVEGIESLDKVFRNIHSLGEMFFIEASACFGSCIAGRGIRDDLSHMEKRGRLLKQKEVYKDAQQEFLPAKAYSLGIDRIFFNQFEELLFEEERILEVLRSTGKHTPRDELNCSACGYDTCREKAKAVLLGKAEKEMCLPYMTNRATSLSNIVIEKFNNIVVIYDKQLRIMYFNPAAETLFSGEEDIMSEIIYEIENDASLATIEKTINHKKYIFFCKTYVIPEEDGKVLMLIDVTKEQLQEERVKALEKQSLEKIEEVINKQMRLAQDIAGILGESVAETKSYFQEFKTYIDKDDPNLRN